jgi:hypothetical protein
MNTSGTVHFEEGYGCFYRTHLAGIEFKELPARGPETTCRRGLGLKLEVVVIPLQGVPAI